jgi:hypothetical protein
MGTARLVQRVSSALMSKSYRSDAGEFEPEDDVTTRCRPPRLRRGHTRSPVEYTDATVALGGARAADPEAAASRRRIRPSRCSSPAEDAALA